MKFFSNGKCKGSNYDDDDDDKFNNCRDEELGNTTDEEQQTQKESEKEKEKKRENKEKSHGGTFNNQEQAEEKDKEKFKYGWSSLLSPFTFNAVVTILSIALLWGFAAYCMILPDSAQTELNQWKKVNTNLTILSIYICNAYCFYRFVFYF